VLQLLEPGSITLEAGTIKGIVLKDDGAKLNLTILAYDNTIRVLVDELPSVDRYQVPDILQPSLKQAAFTDLKPLNKDVWVAQLGDYKLKITGSSFKLEVLSNEKPVIIFNNRHMFNFEQRRQKKEGDPEGWWDESFNGHADSKKNGPEAIAFDVTFPGSKHLYGLPERAENLSLPATAGSSVVSEPYRLYNLDVFEYLDKSPFGLYGSIPMLMAHKKGRTVGVFWLNAAEMYVDVEATSGGHSTQWITESGVLDLLLLLGPGPKDVSRQYAALTGSTAMPQMFSIGYHQCRWNYKDEKDVAAVDAGFDNHAIPYDVLWLDIEHTNGKRYMTWDQHLFPNPKAMQEDVASRGRKMVTIVDPHVKRDEGYYVHKEAQELKHYVKNKDGADFDGWCWPGSSSYLDVTSPVVRSWWAQQFSLSKYQGSTKSLYIWNDMNEPSVFNGPEITMPKDAVHYGDREHRDIHNIFGYYYHLATAEGLINRGKEIYGEDGDRPFVLSRAFYAGTQTVGPIWTGDNAAQWSHLAVSMPMLLTLGLAGLPNSGADVGGFFGNPDPELLTRWYQVGAFYPFFRGHAHLETQRREPWLFGEEVTERIREAIRTRYALLPYMYTLFRHANLTGVPIMRPLWYEFPDQEDLYAIEQEFMLGPAIFVKPVTQAGAKDITMQLPAATVWYESAAGHKYETSTISMVTSQKAIPIQVHKDAIPVFYRGGHIIPKRERPRRSTVTQAKDPFTLIIALDKDGRAAGDLYVDDGRSFAFLKGAYLHRQFTFAGEVLTNNAWSVPEHLVGSIPSQSPPPELQQLVIERLVILGLPQGKEYHAVVGSRTMPVYPWGVGVNVEKGDAMVVRTVSLPVGKDWALKLVEGGLSVAAAAV